MKKWLSMAAAILLIFVLCACGASGAAQKTADLGALYEQLLTAAEDAPEMVRVPESKLEKLFGLHPEDCGEIIVSLCAESVRADEIWLIEAKDETAADYAQEMAAARLEQRKEEMKSYLPDQYAVLQSAELLRQGNYVALLVSPSAAEMAELFEAAFKG